ncbi:DUF502 domain-containing protein [Pedobacter cryoconitis]|uniref:Putative membrane protein n=1 Tax=Pedobacter cryoconitis TaxID=188932 RepID=A0A7X0J224_9SPHI|nr:DUF502 domain-containing protein [Pedobacter cryoconitis]MBB6498221.1 putative membrane protein [Pedobacter cryoconitis]
MNRIGKALLNYLIKGLLIVLPIALSIYIVIWAVTTVDSWLNVNNILGVDPRTGESRNIPGLGLALVIALILTAGIFVTNFVTEPMYNWFNRWMNRLPGLNFIYSSIKDLTEAFVGDEKKFNHPVLVEITADIKRVGFMTQSDLTTIGLPGDCVVYFPFSYSFAGQVCIISKDKIKTLNMSAADAMKLVVSGGVSHI